MASLSEFLVNQGETASVNLQVKEAEGTKMMQSPTEGKFRWIVFWGPKQVGEFRYREIQKKESACSSSSSVCTNCMCYKSTHHPKEGTKMMQSPGNLSFVLDLICILAKW